MTDKNMNQFEDDLKSALRRQQAPPDFTERVLARIAEQNSRTQAVRTPWWSIFMQPLVRWAAVTATAASLVIGGIHYRTVQRERTQGEAAKQQLMLALRIAGNKLHLAKARVNEINASPSTDRSRSEEE